MKASTWLRIFTVTFLLSSQILLILSTPVPVFASNLSLGPTLNLSKDPTLSDFPMMAAAGNNIYVAWQNISSSNLGNAEIFFRASNNNGTSFGPVINLSNTPNENSVNQVLAASGKNVYVVWEDNVSSTNDDIFFRASNNNGTSFGPVINLSNDLQFSTTPQIAAVGSDVYVVWQTGTSAPTDIFFIASTNNGSTFGSVINLSNSSRNTSALNPQIAAMGTFVYVTYTSGTSGSKPVNPQTYFTVSSTSGSSFSTPVSLGKTVTGESDFMPQIAATGSSVFVAWTNDTLSPSNDETMFRASTNNGGVFGTTIDLSNNPSTSLTVRLAAANTNVYVVWLDSVTVGGTEVFYRASNNNGASFASTIVLGNTAGNALTPNIAASGSNVYVTWVNSTSSNDEVLFASSSDNGATLGSILNLSNDSGFSDNPAVAGAGGNAYVAWQDDTPGNDEVFFRGTGALVPDVAVSAVASSRNFAYSGTSANPIVVNVTVSNPGPVTASFVVSAKANTTFIGNNQTVTSLAPGASVVVQFSWNTATLARGKYILTAYASQVTPAGETNLANNSLTWGGTFTSKLKGDVNSDCKVDISDLASVGSSFGKTPGQPGYIPLADLNNDGLVNIVDLVDVAGVFGQTC